MPLTRVTSNVIQDGTIIDADISPTANISRNKFQLSNASGVNTFYLAPRTDGIAGTGTQLDPYDVSNPTKWRLVISSLPNNCTIRLLAGNYNICGIGYNTLDAQMFPNGCSIIGDGMRSTILTVTELSPNIPSGNFFYNAITIIGARDGGLGNPYTTTPRQQYCIVSDLTIDCNWQTFRAVGYKCGAIDIQGADNNIIRRCRVINFGGHNGSLQESFPVSCSGQNAIIEECVVEQPVPGPNETEVYATYLAVGGGLAIWQQTRRTLTANATNNTFEQQQRYKANDPFVFTALVGGSPLIENKIYYVVNPTNNGNVFQLAETVGGTPIDFATVTSAQGCGLSTENNCIIRNNICRGQSASVRDGFGAILGNGYTNLIIEGNVFENLTFGCYGDSWLTGNVAIKNNLFKNCRRCIAAEMGLEQYAQIQQMIISENIFDGYGINGSGVSGNVNFIGGWCLRLSGRINKLIFEKNKINSVDGLPINEAGPFTAETAIGIFRNNTIHSACANANPTPPTCQTIDEENTDEWGIPRWLQPWGLQSVSINGSSGEQVRFTADASTDIISNVFISNFRELDFVYVYNLSDGSGLNIDTRYYVRDLITNASTKRQTFKLYTVKTGGSPVDITVNYTDKSIISNRECRSGKALEAGFNIIKSIAFNSLNTNSSNFRPKTPTLFIGQGIYEHDSSSIFGNLPANQRLITQTLTIVTGNVTINVGTPIWESLEINGPMKIISEANGSNQMWGKLISYNQSTGDIVVNVDQTFGSGTASSWYVLQNNVKVQLIGVGNNKDIILRAYNQTVLYPSTGFVGEIVSKNLTFMAWGPNGITITSGAGSQYYENVIFAQGGGATKAVGAGSNSLGNFSTYINCYSDAVLYDPALNQGANQNSYFENCRFLNGFSPSVQGSIFRNCEINSPMAISLGSGVFENSVYKSVNYQIQIDGGKIYNSRLETAKVQVIGTGNEIHNTTITTTTPTSIFGDGQTVDIFNVGSNQPIGALVIKTNNLTSI
jgi:hypothetical protein